MQEIFGSIKSKLKITSAQLNILCTLVALLLLFFLTVNKIHGSSIGVVFFQLYGSEQIDQNIIFGTPRSIRSDEWNITTPLASSQSWNNFNVYNPYSNGGQFLSYPLDIPTKDWTTIFKPYNWAFFILPFENAFAFRWWFKAELLLFATFSFLWIISKKNYAISFLGTAIIFLAPFNHWWYSGSAASPIDTLSYALLILIFLIKLTSTTNFKLLITYTLALIYSSLCFFFLLYPPFQISIALLIGIFVLTFILQMYKEKKTLVSKNFFISILVTLLCSTFIIIMFLITNKEIISLLKNTTYPGHRIISGGDFTVIQFFSGFFNSYLSTPSDYTPSVFLNKSEGANFLLFYPFLLPIILFNIVKKNFDFITIGLIGYLLFLTTWLFLKLPPIIGQITLFNQIPESRLILGLGFANYLLALNYLISPQIIKSFKLKMYALFLALTAAIIHIIISINLLSSDYFFFKSDYTPFFGNYFTLTIITVVVFLSVYTLIAQHKKSWLLLVLLVSLFSTYSINPIYKGLDIYQNSSLSISLRQIAQNNPSGYWIVYDNFFVSNFLTGSKIKTYTGISLYPKLNELNKLDPQGLNQDLYNRFGYITFKKSNLNNIQFKLNTPDSYFIYIHPCQKELNELNITFIIFESPQKENCLKLIKKYDNLKNPLYVYQRI